jgi:glutamate synthase (NADPH/NADH) small chain
MIRDKKSLFGPFVALKYLFQKPHTFQFPFEQKPTALRYRGLHINERDKCTGCGNCADICPNQAINMVEVPEMEPELGKKNELPQIDYGRCCFCGLCVDICPPGSLSLARDYIHIDHATDSFLYMPDSEKSGDQAFVPASEYSIMKASINHRQAANPGFISDEDYSLVEFDRVPMPVMKPEERKTSFIEMVLGYAEQEARKEASRCLECALCEDACPANMGISRYVRAVWEADYGEAARVIYETNPLPSICGRICTHRCEEACSIGRRGEPVSIRWLKRFAMDQVSPEDYKKVLGTESLEEKDKKVAIVGGGPAGLSCAYFLALMGYRSTIFEARPKPGGIPRYGVPEYRLPYDMLDKDIEYIKSLGVEIRCNTRVGKDITLDELHRDYAAVFIATGLHVGRSTRVEGTDHPKVFQALNLLGDITEGKEIMVGKKIVVIGGGNVAMDIARSMARLQMKKYGQVNLTACCLESEDIMPADREEIDESREEGILIYPARGPDRIEVESGEIKGLHTVECTSVFDEEGRFNPKFNKEDKLFLEGDMIIEAIGQGPDMSFIPKELDEKIEKAGRRIKVDEHFQSSVPWLFFGGDIIQGPDVIHAIVNGHEAAKGIDAYIRGKKED